MGEQVWAKEVAQFCPDAELKVAAAASLPPAIEKLLCKYASNPDVEDKVVEGVCNEVTKKFPDLPFDCKTIGEQVWAKGVAQFCPDAEMSVGAADPLPPAIEKLLCKYASNPDVEDKVVEGVCDEVTKEFPELPFDCKTTLEKLWAKGVASECPEAELSVGAADLLPPAMEKLLCQIASNPDIEDMVVA